MAAEKLVDELDVSRLSLDEELDDEPEMALAIDETSELEPDGVEEADDVPLSCFLV